MVLGVICVDKEIYVMKTLMRLILLPLTLGLTFIYFIGSFILQIFTSIIYCASGLTIIIALIEIIFKMEAFSTCIKMMGLAFLLCLVPEALTFLLEGVLSAREWLFSIADAH